MLELDIARIVGVCVAATVLIALVKPHRPELGIWLAVATAVCVLGALLGRIDYLVRAIADLATRAGTGNVYLATVLRVIGVAYLAGFGAEVCRDAGESAIATKIEFAGKVMILVMALPVLVAVLETVLRFLR